MGGFAGLNVSLILVHRQLKQLDRMLVDRSGSHRADSKLEHT